MNELTDKQKQELIEHMWDIGFLVQEKHFFDLKTDKERFGRIKSLVNEGYRIQLFGDSFDVINIKGITISQEIVDELTDVYNYLF